MVKADQAVEYKRLDGSDRQSLSTAVSDGTTIIKCVCFDVAKFAKFAPGNIVILREVIREKKDDRTCIVAMKATKIFLSNGLDVANSHGDEGRLLVNP